MSLVEIQEIRGKGRGVVALIEIKKGDTIWSETGYSVKRTPNDFAILASQCPFLDQLSVAEPKLKRVLKHKAYWLDQKPQEWTDANWLIAIAKVSTNCFCTLKPPRVYLWQQVSFMNHGCTGNVILEISGDKCIVVARTGIKKGEELTFRYLGGPCKPQVLLASWGFKCGCLTK